MMEQAIWPSQMLLKSLKALVKLLAMVLQDLKTLLKLRSMLQDHMVGWPLKDLKALLKLLAMFLHRLHRKRWSLCPW